MQDTLKIRMLETRRTTECGYKVVQFKRGQVYDVAKKTARTILSKGWAVNMERQEDVEKFNDLYSAKLRLLGIEIINGKEEYIQSV